ncbi:DNA-binding NarL/FixJ family response regulator [Williamsia limnetica]|uniref:DNA-binding NarL/FixJ family response regulator n=1 Tax=Williamsia limnetica TaxID=882452 RepID=A0A318RCT0_WILLI|nr:LuxR C-terminal-related transcriptional regulator [Williamsia limnetica]PYE13291.1 DNA-binding NarL/FixJ family response regulator [Williamsia limnetica]
MARTWPLIERDLEFRTIQAALDSETADLGVVLTGDPGVGKTTLARYATGSMPGQVRWVAGTESARSIPLGAFAHLVGPTTATDPVTFMSAARESLLAGGDTVIGVDDAHLLDELSATLLHQLAIDRAVRIIATVRSGETVPDAVTSLWKDRHLVRIVLSPFSKTQSLELIESVLGGRLEGLSADVIWDASGGNALFLHHLVEGALESGALRQVRGVWQLRGRAAVTSELASLLEGRIEQLDDDALSVLKLLTFCEPLDLDVLCELAGEAAVDDAEARGLIRVARDGQHFDVHYTHPLFGDVIRRRLGIASARRLRGRLVTALLADGVTTASERIRLAELSLDSDQSLDVELFRAAAHDAIALANLPLGERFAEAALTGGGGLAAADLLARALLWQGRAEDSDAVLTAFDPATLDQLQLVQWGLTRVGNLFWSMGDSDRADEVLELVSSRVDHPALLLVVEGMSSACALFEGRLEEGLRRAQVVLDSPSASPWAVEWACFSGGLARALSGRGDEVAALAERGQAVESKTDGLLRFPTGFGEILGLTLTGGFDVAQQRAGRYLAFSTAGQFLGWALANIVMGTVDLARGRLRESAARYEQSLAALDTTAGAAWGFPAQIGLVQSYAALGKADAAQRVLTDARGRTGRYVAVFDPQLELAAAWVAASQGVTGEATARARLAADSASVAGQFAVEAEALHAAARFGDDTVTARLSDLMGRVDGVLVGAYARHAAAVASGDGAFLDRSATEFEELGAIASAADASAQAASAHSGAGERAALATSSARANRLAAMCGGLRTPAMVAAANPLPLTAREREIGTLVAAGLSNRSIAERLTVSVRTVEGHIYRACTKLDLTDRADLATLLSGRSRET